MLTPGSGGGGEGRAAGGWEGDGEGGGGGGASGGGGEGFGAVKDETHWLFAVHPGQPAMGGEQALMHCNVLEKNRSLGSASG